MLLHYLKTAYKVLLRRKFFTFISLFGISATLLVLLVATAMLDHVLGTLPPEVKAARTLGVYFATASSEEHRYSGDPGYRLLELTTRRLQSAEKVSIFSMPGKVVSFRAGTKIESFLRRTDGPFWEILEFSFVEGRPLTREDEASGAFVAVINEETRLRFFDGQPAVGKDIEADGQRFRVVGVVKNVPVYRLLSFADIWVPLSTAKSSRYREQYLGGFMSMVLARDPKDFPAIRAEFAQLMTGVSIPPDTGYNQVNAGLDTFLEAASRMFTGGESAQPRVFLLILVGLGFLFLLLPTVNLVNINVSRILERASEIGVRRAFGASSGTLVGQFLVENVVLSLVGGALGLLLAMLALWQLSGSGLFPYADFHVNWRIFGYATIMALVFGVISGVYPAWKMSRLHPVEALRGRSL